MIYDINFDNEAVDKPRARAEARRADEMGGAWMIDLFICTITCLSLWAKEKKELNFQLAYSMRHFVRTTIPYCCIHHEAPPITGPAKGKSTNLPVNSSTRTRVPAQLCLALQASENATDAPTDLT